MSRSQRKRGRPYQPMPRRSNPWIARLVIVAIGVLLRLRLARDLHGHHALERLLQQRPDVERQLHELGAAATKSTSSGWTWSKRRNSVCERSRPVSPRTDASARDSTNGTWWSSVSCMRCIAARSSPVWRAGEMASMKARLGAGRSSIARSASASERAVSRSWIVRPTARRAALLSEKLHVAEKTVWRWIREGHLRAYRVGRLLRIPNSALQDFLSVARRLGALVGARIAY